MNPAVYGKTALRGIGKRAGSRAAEVISVATAGKAAPQGFGKGSGSGLAKTRALSY